MKNNIELEIARLVELIGERKSIVGGVASMYYLSFLHLIRQRQPQELSLITVGGCKLKVYGTREVESGLLVALESTTRSCNVKGIFFEKCIILLRKKEEITYLQKNDLIEIKSDAFVSSVVLLYSSLKIEKGMSSKFFRKLPHLGEEDFEKTDESFLVGGDLD